MFIAVVRLRLDVDIDVVEHRQQSFLDDLLLCAPKLTILDKSQFSERWIEIRSEPVNRHDALKVSTEIREYGTVSTLSAD